MVDRTIPLQQAVDNLAESGLNLYAALDVDTLPDSIRQPLSEDGVDLSRFATLVLLGNGGQRFWETLPTFGLDHPDPIDRYSLALTGRFIEELALIFAGEQVDHLNLYPQTAFRVPLQRLGTLVGWGEPSPLGNSIHPDFGLWFAFRSAFLITLPLPQVAAVRRESPCVRCRDKLCQSACPAAAVLSDAAHFKLNDCIDHRLAANSTCQARCMARLACPVSADQRYPDWAIHHLYRHSFAALRKWQDGQKGE